MKEILLKTENLSKSFSNGGAMQHVLKNINHGLYRVSPVLCGLFVFF